MLKERKLLLCSILVVAAIVLCGVFFLGRNRRFETLGKEDGAYDPEIVFSTKELGETVGKKDYVEHEVLCMVENEEEAQKVADAVNGRLKSWQDGVAVIAIEETVQEFLKKYSGVSDLPVMYPNYIYHNN